MSSGAADEVFTVVVNHEEQHSLWPSTRALPPGWRAIGFEGDRAACLEHIEAVWPDIRPLSLRQALAALEVPAPPGAPEPGQ